MSRFWFYAGLPEMRNFWFFLPFLIALLVINFLYISDQPVQFVADGALLVFAATAFATSYSSARLNFRTKVERNELHSIVLNMSDAIIAYDSGFKVLFFNPAAEKLFGVRAEEMVGQEIKPRAAEDPKSRLMAQVVFPSLAPTLVSRSKAGEYPQVVDISFDHPVLELRVTTSPITDEHGNLVGFMKIVRNRTRELALLKSKDEFISVASHQLRTPVSELHWAMEALEQNKKLDEEAASLVKNATGSVNRLMNTVEDLLDVSKIEQGRFGYQFQPTDIVKFLDDILGSALVQAQRAGVKLYFDRPKDPLPQVMVDSQKLTMVVSNLIDNAIRYNVSNGQIIVKARKVESHPFLEVDIEDTGIGIPAEEIKKVFEKFFRASNALKFQTEGSGLGLYIAKNIIEAHGGQMWAESELNRGTTFHFTIPTDPSLVPTKEAGVEY